MSTAEIVLNELENITGTDQVRKDLNLDLFGEKVLDSFGTVELIVALSDAFSLDISPGQIDREMWATPQKIIEYFEQKVNPS
jgi:D-alanine--poly(phosphoribitol) ligase subunit 2